ncbi:hypothetical protein FA13DRAFT_1792357 [Coprinellus micaceus]|uniref:Transcription activator of gluconeogenesis ERT1 n=1 Tax=Coprinellus micaceus TaxID=71717 RepID=A0A4Y7T8S8_COPMI|nr:hypothetical protein FA13DRAFT_1792357 [Coprinellus micaceus]
MSTVYAVAPRPAHLAVSTPRMRRLARRQRTQRSRKKSSQTSLTSKRKRNETPEDSQDSTASQPSRKARDGPKKKKANRACFHCQKAHLTCDDSRPCQRCIKRGIASNCTEGHRKKAKYLLDDEELEQLKRSKAGLPLLDKERGSEEPAPIPITEPAPQTESILATAFDPTFTFGSEAANLEYSILSAILGNPSPTDSASTSPPPAPPSAFSPWPVDTIDFATSPRLGTAGSAYPSSFSDAQLALASPESALSTSPGNPPFLTYGYSQSQRSEDAAETPLSSQFQSQSSLHPLQPRYPLDGRPRSPPTVTYEPVSIKRDTTAPGLLTPPLTNGSPNSIASVPIGSADLPPPKSTSSQLQSIHDRVTAPYDYTQGYHFLMKHLPIRFEKNDILRIVRALAIYRPSLIALQMPLSLEDEVFVEKCFQRSLLELGKLISYSGTPTVVWRRTGEICLVAPEFCMLTEWPMEELVGRKKYIYELFENQSVVEYWENFASHAFENTTRSVYSHCVLLKPSGAPVPATFCFTIKRDLFDLPSMVIGQWLPLL